MHDQHLDDVALFSRQFKPFTHLLGKLTAAMHVRGFARPDILAQIMQQQSQLQQFLVRLGRLFVKPSQRPQHGRRGLRQAFDLFNREKCVFVNRITMMQIV